MEIDLEEALARLQIALAPGVGVPRAWRWIRAVGRARDLVSARADVLEALAIPAAVAGALTSSESRRAAEREWALAESHGIRFLFPEPRAEVDRGAAVAGAPEEAFSALEVPPLVVTYRGDSAWLAERHLRVAVVGTRTPTPYGAAQSRRFAGALAESGVVVVSGFARGVDREAHSAALEAGGATIAILGSGLLSPYPADRPELMQQIEERGMVLSEFPLESRASKPNFPRRNRLLSGVSRAVVVIEAGSASGSLITARWAIDQDREVFALPGRVDSPMSRGCHELLAAGEARFLQSPEELTASLGIAGGGCAAAAMERGDSCPPGSGGVSTAPSEAGRTGVLGEAEGAELPSHEAALLASAAVGASVEELAHAWLGPPEEFFGVLLKLELEGRLLRAAGGLFRLPSSPRSAVPRLRVD